MLHASGDHCNAEGMGYPKVPNCHSYGHICYKVGHGSQPTWSKLQVVPSTSEWARGHSPLYDPHTNNVCVHYNGGRGDRDTKWVGDRFAQCLDLSNNQWGEPKNITKDLRSPCNIYLGSRQTGAYLPSGRQVFTLWHFPGSGTCIYVSDDHGDTFHVTQHIENSSEGAVVWLPKTQQIYYNARHEGEGPLRVTGISDDNGDSFKITYNSTDSPPDTKKDSCPGPLLYLNDYLYLSLPTGPGRLSIDLHGSHDNGKTWPYSNSVDKGRYGGYSGLSARHGMDDTIAFAWESGPKDPKKCNGACSVWFTFVTRR